MHNVTILTAAPAAILAARGLMTNAERLERPIAAEHALILLEGGAQVPLDTRRLAAHRLLDLAIEQKDAAAVHRVVEVLHAKDKTIQAPGLLGRIAKQRLDMGWRQWARKRLKPKTVPAEANAA